MAHDRSLPRMDPVPLSAKMRAPLRAKPPKRPAAYGPLGKVWSAAAASATATIRHVGALARSTGIAHSASFRRPNRARAVVARRRGHCTAHGTASGSSLLAPGTCATIGQQGSWRAHRRTVPADGFPSKRLRRGAEIPAGAGPRFLLAQNL